jgi:hypothetical protein
MKTVGVCGNNIQRVKIELDGKIIEEVLEFKYLGNTIFFDNTNIELKIRVYNNINGIIRRSYKKEISREAQLRLHNITSKAALTYGSGNWVLKQRNKDSKQHK